MRRGSSFTGGRSAPDAFLPRDPRRRHPNAIGDLPGEIRKFLDLGMDGFFTDQPDIGVKARNDTLK